MQDLSGGIAANKAAPPLDRSNITFEDLGSNAFIISGPDNIKLWRKSLQRSQAAQALRRWVCSCSSAPSS
jgi:hypothetical protein